MLKGFDEKQNHQQSKEKELQTKDYSCFVAMVKP
jgi:hypothetical protein